MPVTIKKHPEGYAVKITGDKVEFKANLEKVKGIPGRKWDPTSKVWVLMDDINTLMRAVEELHPELSAEVRDEVRGAQEKVADDLVTQVGADSKNLLVPWAAGLRPFQRAGVDFAVKNRNILWADDMGLGKTVQSITAVEEFYSRHVATSYEADKTPHEMIGADTYRTAPVLVICPNSARGSVDHEGGWWAEITRGPNPKYFDRSTWPKLEATIVDGSTPQRRKAQIKAAVEDNEYVIINWEKLRLHPELRDYKWAAVIADEAHRAKNPRAKQTKALHRLKAPIKFALTGTPIMNSPDELWSPLHWLYPDAYGNFYRFDSMFVEGYKGFKGKKIVTGVRNPDALRFELSDKMIRRTKMQVLDDFPEKLQAQEIELEMGAKQRRAYLAAENEFVLDVELAMSDPEYRADNVEPEDILAALKSGDKDRLKFLIPNAGARLSRMRQIATSPALLDEGFEDESVKMDYVQERINDHPGKQFVIACHHKASTEVFAARLRRQKPAITCAVMNGDVPAKDRAQMVEDFQSGAAQVFIATIAVASTAITLTASDTVFFLEEDWVPANNRQMEDRVWRIGQDRPVSIIRVRAADTVDTNDIAPANRLKKLMEMEVLGSEGIE